MINYIINYTIYVCIVISSSVAVSVYDHPTFPLSVNVFC